MNEHNPEIGMHHRLPNYFSFLVLAIVVGLVGTAFTTATGGMQFAASVVTQTKNAGKQVVTKKALPKIKAVSADSFVTFDFFSNGDERMVIALPERNEEDSDGGLLGGLGLSSLNPLDVIKRAVNPIKTIKEGINVTKEVTGQVIKNANPINGIKQTVETTKNLAEIAKDGLNPLNVIKNGLRPDRIGILDPKADGNDDDVYYSYRKVAKKSVVIEEAKEGGLPVAVEGSSWIGYRKNLAKRGASQYTRYMATETVNLPAGVPVSGVLAFKSLEDKIDVYVNGVKVFTTKKVDLRNSAQVVDITSPLKAGKNVIKIYAEQNQLKRHAGGFSYKGSIVVANPITAGISASALSSASPAKLVELMIPGTGEEMNVSSFDAYLKFSNVSELLGEETLMSVLKEARLVDATKGMTIATATAWEDSEGAGECELKDDGLLCHFGSPTNPLKYSVKQDLGSATVLNLVIEVNVPVTVSASLVSNPQSLVSKASSRYFTLPSITGSSVVVNP